MTDQPAPPPPPQPPYQAPYQQPYPYQAPATPKVDGLAIASMVLGIIWIYWIGSILAIIFGAIALKRINASNGWRTGKGMAQAGLVLGIIGVGIFALVVAIGVASGVSSS